MTLNLLNKYVHFTKSCSFLIHTGSEDAVWLRKKDGSLAARNVFFVYVYVRVCFNFQPLNPSSSGALGRVPNG